MVLLLPATIGHGQGEKHKRINFSCASFLDRGPSFPEKSLMREEKRGSSRRSPTASLVKEIFCNTYLQEFVGNSQRSSRVRCGTSIVEVEKRVLASED